MSTFLVTSAVAGDGKSTIISNLAVSIAKTGRSVLLLDADFRNPTLHTKFEIENVVGLSNFLEGKYDVDQITQATKYDGVALIPTGDVPEDPADLLGLPAFGEMLEALKEKYDIVLIDVTGC